MPMIRTKHLLMEVRDEGPRTGFPILLVHAWPDDASAWSGHRRRSIGQASEPSLTCTEALEKLGSCRRMRLAPARSVSLQWMRWISWTLSLEQFFVAGHDWGSNVAEALAVGCPGLIERIAMISTPSRLGVLKTTCFEP
jgi:pimeloyl-ACP methyl ester carboxylesterase